jgi:hypothetical protein
LDFDYVGHLEEIEIEELYDVVVRINVEFGYYYFLLDMEI